MMSPVEKTSFLTEFQTLPRPPDAPLDCAATSLLLARIRRALIENHRDVRAEFPLDFHSFPRTEKHIFPVEMRLKRNPVLADFPELSQTKNLKTAAIGQYRFLPAHKRMQATEFSNQIFARSKMQMVGISENDLSAEVVELSRGHAFHRSLGSDRHENRCLDLPVPRSQHAGPGGSRCFGFVYLKMWCHLIISKSDSTHSKRI